MSQQYPQQPGHNYGPNPGQGNPAYAAYPQQQAPQGPPPGQKKPITKKWWFWLLLIVVGGALLSRCGGGSETVTPPAPAGGESQVPAASKAPAKKAETAAAMNTPVKDDEIEFTVTSFKCGVTVKGFGSNLTPQGQFCALRLTAKNVGTKQVTLMDDNLKVTDAGGAEYRSSSETWAAEGNILLKAINPGNTMNGTVYYDVPQGVTPKTAVLQGGYFSKGAKIDLA